MTSCGQGDGYLEYTVRIPIDAPAPLPVPDFTEAPCHAPEMPEEVKV